MPDLYAALNVPRDVDADTIKRAYRNAARKAHPDAGGDRKRFDLIILARDTLTDDARRARYDETGEIGEKPVDNHQSGVMSMLSAGLDAALSKLYQKAQPPIQSDMPGLVKAEMAELRRKWNGERTELRKAIVITHELLGRWSAKGDNVMETITSHRVRYLEGCLSTVDGRIALMDEALGMLDGVKFRMDYAPPQSPAQRWIAGGMTSVSLSEMLGGRL